MQQLPENDFTRKFMSIIKGLDKLGLFLVILAIALYIFKLPFASLFVGVVFTAYAIVCFLGAFLPFKSTSQIELIALKVLGISSAISLIGLQYYFLALPGGGLMIGVGTPILAISTLMVWVFFNKTQNENYPMLLLRGAILTAINAYIMITQMQ